MKGNDSPIGLYAKNVFTNVVYEEYVPPYLYRYMWSCYIFIVIFIFMFIVGWFTFLFICSQNQVRSK